MASKQAFSWTQPVCDDCWNKLKIKTGRQHRSDARHCCYCNTFISAGDIFFNRVNPGSVPYPTITKDEEL